MHTAPGVLPHCFEVLELQAAVEADGAASNERWVYRIHVCHAHHLFPLEFTKHLPEVQKVASDNHVAVHDDHFVEFTQTSQPVPGMVWSGPE